MSLGPDSRQPASPQKGLMAMSETLNAEACGHDFEVRVWCPLDIGAALAEFELRIDGEPAEVGFVRLQSARRLLKTRLADGTGVRLKVERGLVRPTQYRLTVNG